MVKIGSDSKKYVPQITESSEKTHLENLRISLNKLCEITVTIWKPNARISHSGDLKSGLFEGQISNGWAFAMAKAIVPTIQNPDIFVQIFNVFFYKMAPICLDLKSLGVRISDPIWNPDHLQPNIFLAIQNPDYSGFQIPTVFIWIRTHRPCHLNFNIRIPDTDTFWYSD